MNKNLTIVVVIIIILLLGGAGFYFLNKNKSASLENTSQSVVPTGSVAESDNNVITSIKDALTRSQTLECNYTDEEGRVSKAYIKNGAIRSDYTSTDPKESGGVIMKDKKMYLWTTQTKTGFTMEIPEVTLENITPSVTTGSQGSDQQDEVLEDLENYKEHCKNASVSDSVFTPPSDIKFTDFSGFMNIPTGAPGSSTSSTQPTIDPKQIEQLMKQYGNTSEN